MQFPFDAFVFVLRELRGGLGGEDRSAAWIAVNRAYEDHPEFMTRGEVPLYAAAADLAVGAWDVAVEAGAACEMEPGGFEGPVESHALARLREGRALRRVRLSVWDERGESGSKGEEGGLEWGAWQQMLHDAGYWQGFAFRHEATTDDQIQNHHPAERKDAVLPASPPPIPPAVTSNPGPTPAPPTSPPSNPPSHPQTPCQSQTPPTGSRDKAPQTSTRRPPSYTSACCRCARAP